MSFRCSHCATHFLDICEALGPGRPGGPSSAKKRGSCPEAMPPQTKSREDYAVPLHALRWDAPKGPWRLFHAGTSPPFARSGGVRRRAPGFSTRAELVLQACLTLRGRLFPFPRLSLAVGRFPEPHVGMQCNPNISIEGALRLSLFSFVDL